MRRLGFAAALLFVTGWLSVGCFGDPAAVHPTGAECGGGESYDEMLQSAAACEGGVCISLFANKQNMSGLCSAECSVESDCNGHEHCESVSEGTFCFRACESDDDCYDAGVCRLLSLGSQRRYCLVDPL